MFSLPSSKPEAMEPNRVPMRPFQPLLASHKTCCLDQYAAVSTQPQTVLYVSDVKHLLGHVSAADRIYKRGQNKCLLVVVVKKQTRQTVG